MIPSSSEFIDMMTPEEKTIYKLGRIDPAYISGRPKIVFAGESVASTKQYPYLSSYTPVANDKVLILVVAGSYVILGKVI